MSNTATTTAQLTDTEAVFFRLAADALSTFDKVGGHRNAAASDLVNAAVKCGWMRRSSTTQAQWSDAGAAHFDQVFGPADPATGRRPNR